MHLKIWETAINQVLPCTQKPDNLEDTNAVAVTSKGKQLFLKLKSNSIAFRVTNGSDNELELPCEYIIKGDTKAVEWILQKLKKKTKLCKNLVAINRQVSKTGAYKIGRSMYRMRYNVFLLAISSNNRL